MENRELLEIIRTIIHQETKYMRCYLGKIVDVNDASKQGRVLVIIPSLGWKTNEQGVWCNGIDKNALITPQLNDWVIVQFVNNNSAQGLYLGIANNIQDMLPQNYDGNSTTNILFENNNKDTYIKWDDTTHTLHYKDVNNNEIIMKSGEIDIKGTMIKMLNGTQPFVLGTAFDTWITATLLTIFNAHVHTSASPGSPTSSPTTPLTAPSNYLSTTIKGS